MFVHMGAMSGIGSETSRGKDKGFDKTTLPEGDMSPLCEI